MLAARRRKELEAACAEAGGECVAADLASPVGCERVTMEVSISRAIDCLPERLV